MHVSSPAGWCDESSLDIREKIDIMEGTFHRRELLPPAISFSSPAGRSLFMTALAGGTMESYFRLSEQYTTQGHPSFCGIGSLTMVLNALLVDPRRVWQGVWRWYDESMLDCCETLDVVRARGITLPKLACLARCNGADVNLHYGPDISVERFRDLVVECSSCSGNDCSGCCIIVSYGRAVLNQTGTGHFSPIGGYSREKDMVLILDVARFKYPPHWVPLELLHAAMCTTDEDSGQPRGCMVLTPSAALREQWCTQHDPATTNMTTFAEIDEEDDTVLPPAPVPASDPLGSQLPQEFCRNRSNTGAAIGALWGICDWNSSDELSKDNPISALIKHRCEFCK